MSAKQKYMIAAAFLITIVLAAGLLYYSMAQTASYDGIFVSTGRQWWC